MKVAAAILLSMLGMSAPVRADAPRVATISAEEQAAIKLAAERGSLIYAYDQAAWHGTDDMVARLKANGTYDRVAPTLGGWVVEGPVTAPVLTFFDKDVQHPRVLYTATLSAYGRSVVSAALTDSAQNRQVTAAELALVTALKRAREAIAKSDAKLCVAKPPNTVVLPPATAGGQTLVYFLTPQVENGSFPMGGHYRVEVGTDATTPVIRPFAKSCLTVDSQVKGGARAAALTVTHLLDPVPTEIHVFTMFAAATPVFVATMPNNRLWSVSAPGGEARIESLGNISAPAKK